MAYSGSNIDGAPAAPKVRVAFVSPAAAGADDADPDPGAEPDPVSLAGADVSAAPVDAPGALALDGADDELSLRSELAHAARDTATVAASPATISL
ncbi:hypothetical protein [Nakamurella lactea]|uniref:hypothetical protein n=1 Tax=Nakamurella lactea TaxID=459515 RepID=UPI001FE0FCC3|nr:hypothetical protein [Nakamurella lactea]